MMIWQIMGVSVGLGLVVWMSWGTMNDLDYGGVPPHERWPRLWLMSLAWVTPLAVMAWCLGIMSAWWMIRVGLLGSTATILTAWDLQVMRYSPDQMVAKRRCQDVAKDVCIWLLQVETFALVLWYFILMTPQAMSATTIGFIQLVGGAVIRLMLWMVMLVPVSMATLTFHDRAWDWAVDQWDHRRRPAEPAIEAGLPAEGEEQ